MNFIIGLGNPGDQYKSTKHNFGFWVLNKLIEDRSLKLKAGKGDYVFSKDNQCILVKPTTFVNNSGIAIKQILDYYDNIDISKLLVVYDDIDINLGNIRFKSSGEDGGHNGIYRARPDGSEMTHVIKDGIGKSGLRGIGKKENSFHLFFIHHTYLVHLDLKWFIS